jgi:hypothetical protein
VETSIISYLAARPSRDLIVAARQQVTHAWWRERRPLFELYVSQVVLDEILAGDPDAAKRRAALASGIFLLDITPEVADLAAALIQRVPFADHGWRGCRAHRRSGLPWDRTPADVELDSSRKRGVAATR